MGVKNTKARYCITADRAFIIKSTKTNKISFLKTKKPIRYELMVQRYYHLRNKQHIFC